jgi:Zn-dependent peptidase ImmA (M78 family)
MPKCKTNSLNVKSYNEEKIQKALEEFKRGFPKKTVAKKFGIPRSTLQFRLSSKFKKKIAMAQILI